MKIKEICAPIPGTFYRKPGPDQPFYKNEGDTVIKGETIGLIEVMKTFTSVVAEDSGRILKCLVEDEDSVMAGQPLYEIETS